MQLNGLAVAIEAQMFRTHAKRDGLAALQSLTVDVSDQRFAALRQLDRHAARFDRTRPRHR